MPAPSPQPAPAAGGAAIPPGGAIVVFDGECNLCTPWVPFIMQRDPREIIKFASIQSEAGKKLYAQYGLDPNDPETMLVITAESAHFRSDGFVEIAKRMNGLGPFVGGILRLIPRGLRNWGYGIIARNRYRWFGRRDSCLMPTPENKRRFLD